MVRDRGSGAIGSVVHHMKVPDPDGWRVSSPILSDLLESDGGRRPRIVARRRLAAGSVLYCYFELFEASAAVEGPGLDEGSYEIVDAGGEVRHRGALPPPVRNDGGGLGRTVEVPLARIEPGEYQLVMTLGRDRAETGLEIREPFAVTPPRGFTEERYREALAAYLGGDVQEAVATLLQWPPREVLAAAERLPETDDGLHEAALLLHTDLAMLLRKHGLHTGAETQLDIGRALAEGTATSDPELHRDWLLALAYAHQARLRNSDALALYTECARTYPDTGEALLGAGTPHERSAFPDGFGRGDVSLSPHRAASEAERCYRDALQVEPALTEARLRLARVLQRTGRAEEALPHLAAVVSSGQDASLVALAHLFSGEILECRDDVEKAVEHDRAAVAADPELQVAALALAQALHRRQGREAAVDVLFRLSAIARA